MQVVITLADARTPRRAGTEKTPILHRKLLARDALYYPVGA
jgi:hypothetical protein